MAGNRKFKAWLKNGFSPRATLGLAWVILYSVVYTAVPSAATTMKFSRWKFNIAVVCFWDEFRINFWCICRFHFGIGYSLAGRESPAERERDAKKRKRWREAPKAIDALPYTPLARYTYEAKLKHFHPYLNIVFPSFWQENSFLFKFIFKNCAIYFYCFLMFFKIKLFGLRRRWLVYTFGFEWRRSLSRVLNGKESSNFSDYEKVDIDSGIPANSMLETL